MVPNFTAEEAMAFVQGLRREVKATIEGERIIDGVRFALPGQFGDQQLAANQHPDRLLCAVWSHGLQAIPGPPPLSGQIENRGPSMRNIVTYFDAKTGNYLSMSSSPRQAVATNNSQG
jgi:hypothetical protein